MNLRFGPRVVGLEFDDRGISQEAGDVLSAWQTAEKPNERFSVSSAGAGYQFRRNGSAWFTSGAEAHPLPHLLRAIWGTIALDVAPCLHAALLLADSRPLLIVAASGNGKSTLSRLLVERGLDYYTDEISYTDAAGTRWCGVNKPVAHKAHNSLFSGDTLGHGPFATPDKGDVFYWSPEGPPPDPSGLANIRPLVVFPEFAPGDDTMATTLPPAATIHRALVHFFDTGLGIEARSTWLIRAFRDAEGLGIRYGDPRDAADLIRDRAESR